MPCRRTNAYNRFGVHKLRPNAKKFTTVLSPGQEAAKVQASQP